MKSNWHLPFDYIESSAYILFSSLLFETQTLDLFKHRLYEKEEVAFNFGLDPEFSLMFNSQHSYQTRPRY